MLSKAYFKFQLKNYVGNTSVFLDVVL